MPVPDRHDLPKYWLGTPPMPLDLNGPADVPFVPLRRTLEGQPLKVWIATAAALHANRIAIDDGKHALSYAELWTAACRMAQVIKRATPEGRPIAVLLPNIARYPIAWIGCLLAGRPAALHDTNYPAERRGRRRRGDCRRDARQCGGGRRGRIHHLHLRQHRPAEGHCDQRGGGAQSSHYAD